MSCPNRVVQYVPRGYDYKAVELSCGSTGIDGSPLYCDSCVKAGAVSLPSWQYEDAGEADFYPEESIFHEPN